MFWIIIASVVVLPYFAALLFGVLRGRSRGFRSDALLRWKVRGYTNEGEPTTRHVFALSEPDAEIAGMDMGVSIVESVSLTRA